MTKNKTQPKRVWGKWIRPRLKLLTYKDSIFWISLGIFITVSLHPLLAGVFSFLQYRSCLRLSEIAGAMISFAAILSAISLGMATMLLALPSGRFLEALDRPQDPAADLEKPKNVPYLELTFIAYWTGISTMFLVIISVAAMVIGPNAIFINSNSWSDSILTGCLAAVSIYVVLQVIACLNAILGASRLSYFFRQQDG